MSGGNGREIIVRVADLQVGGAGDVLVTVGLGSCIAIVLHDPVARVGGRRSDEPGERVLDDAANRQRGREQRCSADPVAAPAEAVARRGLARRGQDGAELVHDRDRGRLVVDGRARNRVDSERHDRVSHTTGRGTNRPRTDAVLP